MVRISRTVSILFVYEGNQFFVKICFTFQKNKSKPYRSSNKSQIGLDFSCANRQIGVHVSSFPNTIPNQRGPKTKLNRTLTLLNQENRPALNSANLLIKLVLEYYLPFSWATLWSASLSSGKFLKEQTPEEQNRLSTDRPNACSYFYPHQTNVARTDKTVKRQRGGCVRGPGSWKEYLFYFFWVSVFAVVYFEAFFKVGFLLLLFQAFLPWLWTSSLDLRWGVEQREGEASI